MVLGAALFIGFIYLMIRRYGEEKERIALTQTSKQEK